MNFEPFAEDAADFLREAAAFLVVLGMQRLEGNWAHPLVSNAFIV